jgi:hypothetical protein
MLIPIAVTVFAAAAVILFFDVLLGFQIPIALTRIIITALSFAFLYGFFVVVISLNLTKHRIAGHRENTYIEIYDKNLIISQFVQTAVINKSVRTYKRLWIADIKTIDDIIVKKRSVIFKIKAKYFNDDADFLAYEKSEDGLRFKKWMPPDAGKSVTSFEITDNYTDSERIAQRIFLVAGNIRARDARRERFRKEMLERAKNAPRLTRLRDRVQPKRRPRY